MFRAQKEISARVQAVLKAWENMRPHKQFFGLTLEAFKQRAKPFMDARDEIAEPRATSLTGAVEAGRLPARSLVETVQGIVSAVKGDPEEGHNGELYSAMGYVPKNQQRRGLGRRAARSEEASHKNDGMRPWAFVAPDVVGQGPLCQRSLAAFVSVPVLGCPVSACARARTHSLC